MSESASKEEQERAILEQRARALAKPRTELRASASEKYARFERGGIRYAIEPRFVFAVARAPEPTPLPGSLPHWCGVSSVHGELLAVVDLAALLESGAAFVPRAPSDSENGDSEDRLLLVLGTERREFGLVIDALLESVALDVELARAPAGDPSAQLIIGMTADGTRVVRGDALLGEPRLFIQANHFTEA